MAIDFSNFADSVMSLQAPPYLRDGMTKLKMILPVGKSKAWRLIATSRGIASWFPAECNGRVVPGKNLEFIWPDGVSEEFKVSQIGEKHSSFHLEWRNGARLRFYLHGRLTTMTLEVHYPKTGGSRANQMLELAFWVFLLTNLKSIALKGPDLRNQLKGRSWERGFIDSGAIK